LDWIVTKSWFDLLSDIHGVYEEERNGCEGGKGIECGEGFDVIP
jgi:hypothetical protein